MAELHIKVVECYPVLLIFFNKPRNRVKILYWERNGYGLRLQCLDS